VLTAANSLSRANHPSATEAAKEADAMAKPTNTRYGAPMVLGRRDVAVLLARSLHVAEADPVERLVLGAPEAREVIAIDELALLGRDPGLGRDVSPLISLESP
jgi:hypothetical protein